MSRVSNWAVGVDQLYRRDELHSRDKLLRFSLLLAKQWLHVVRKAKTLGNFFFFFVDVGALSLARSEPSLIALIKVPANLVLRSQIR